MKKIMLKILLENAHQYRIQGKLAEAKKIYSKLSLLGNPESKKWLEFVEILLPCEICNSFASPTVPTNFQICLCGRFNEFKNKSLRMNQVDKKEDLTISEKIIKLLCQARPLSFSILDTLFPLLNLELMEITTFKKWKSYLDEFQRIVRLLIFRLSLLDQNFISSCNEKEIPILHFLQQDPFQCTQLETNYPLWLNKLYFSKEDYHHEVGRFVFRLLNESPASGFFMSWKREFHQWITSLFEQKNQKIFLTNQKLPFLLKKQYCQHILTLPNAILLEICRFLPYKEVISLHTISHLWKEILMSRLAQEWDYFPVLVNVDYLCTLYSLEPYDQFVSFEQKDIFVRRKNQFNKSFGWGWNYNGTTFRPFKIYLSDWFPTLQQDLKHTVVALCDLDAHFINLYKQYFDTFNDVYWVQFGCWKFEHEGVASCYSQSNVVLADQNNTIYIYSLLKGLLLSQFIIPDQDKKGIILSLAIDDGRIRVLYQNVLYFINFQGILLEKYTPIRAKWSWISVATRSNYIFLCVENPSFIEVINRAENRRLSIALEKNVPKHCKQLGILHNILCLQGDDEKSIVLFKLIKK